MSKTKSIKICRGCDGEFKSYTSANKLYCSRKCYEDDRSPVKQGSNRTIMTCPKCKTDWPLTAWYWHKRPKRPDGFRTPCRACSARVSRAEIVRLEMLAGEGFKVCNGCKEAKPRTTEFFSPAQKGKYFTARCKACYAAEKAKRWNKDPEKYRAAVRKSYELHKERRNEEARAWHERNKAAVSANKAAYYEANSLQIRLKSYRRRERRDQAEGTCSRQELARKLKEQGYRCKYCNSAIGGKNATVDHIVPLSRGGSNFPENLCWACKSCNSRKHTLPVEVFVKRLNS